MSIFFSQGTLEHDHGGQPVHGMFPEDFEKPILVCGVCRDWSVKYKRDYRDLILHYHGVQLGEDVGEQVFVLFSGQNMPILETAEEQKAKIGRLNALKRLFAGKRK